MITTLNKYLPAGHIFPQMLNYSSIQSRAYWRIILTIFNGYRHYNISTLTKILIVTTVWKLSKYGVFSGPYFPSFGLNTERYEVSLRIQSECEKIRTRKYPVFGHFSHSVRNILLIRCKLHTAAVISLQYVTIYKILLYYNTLNFRWKFTKKFITFDWLLKFFSVKNWSTTS